MGSPHTTRESFGLVTAYKLGRPKIWEEVHAGTHSFGTGPLADALPSDQGRRLTAAQTEVCHQALFQLDVLVGLIQT